MGLDISVVSNLSRLTTDEDDSIHIYVNPHFKEQADDLQSGSYDGEYVSDFRAGSYSGYNEWRSMLANMALGVNPEIVWNHPEFKGQPFYELIHFSDCEGTIGPKTSGKLYRDFIAFDERARAIGDEYFYQKYLMWTKAFQTASEQNGAVLFH